MKRLTGIQHGLLILNNLTTDLQVSGVLPEAGAQYKEPEKAKRYSDDAHVVSILRFTQRSNARWAHPQRWRYPLTEHPPEITALLG